MGLYKKYVQHFGVDTQQRKFAEEHFELQKAITEYETDVMAYFGDTSKNLKEHIAEEIADNIFLLFQFADYYGIEEKTIEEWLDFKQERLDNRIEEANKNEITDSK